MNKENSHRRHFVKTSSGVALFSSLISIGFILPKSSLAATWKEAWFSTIDLAETLKVMGVKDVTESKKVNISAPDTAENGAYVGVSVSTEIDEIEMVAILVDKNPIILSGYFEFNSKVAPNISTKIKMAESSNIFNIVKTTKNDYFMAKKFVKVTLGGCGS
jgi:sulfur-oxidizing protein SoxY